MTRSAPRLRSKLSRVRGSVRTEEAVEYVRAALEVQADPEKAAGMQAYMKTEMLFYGVQKPGRVQIMRQLKKQFVPETRDAYERLVQALWNLPHREEKYLAQAVATTFKSFVVPESLPLYRRMITEGAWWDFVDETATHMIRPLVIGYPEEVWPVVDTWIDDENMWLRRAAIICQVGAKDATDSDRLFRFCERRAHETEFFIRKAIGWALREYAKTDPSTVAQFMREHQSELSGLSYREASKHIKDLVER